MPGIVDVHWHGAMGDEGIMPEQNWSCSPRWRSA